MILRVLLVAMLVVVLFGGSSQGATGVETGISEALQVLEIFKAKCADCHGEKLAKPKGRFGYVLDLKRVAANAEYVTPGKPDASELYLLVRDDEMPGEDADVPALTQAEKTVVKRWIELGAPSPFTASVADGGVATASEAAGESGDSRMKELPLMKRAMRFVGKFHAASTHLPIGLLLAAVIAELLGLLFRTERGWDVTIRFLVILGSASALATAVLGWFNGETSSYGAGQDGWVFFWHRALGISVAVWGAVCAWRLLSHPCELGSRERLQLRGALWLGALLVTAAGALGGALVYGLDHYTW